MLAAVSLNPDLWNPPLMDYCFVVILHFIFSLFHSNFVNRLMGLKRLKKDLLTKIPAMMICTECKTIHQVHIIKYWSFQGELVNKQTFIRSSHSCIWTRNGSHAKPFWNSTYTFLEETSLVATLWVLEAILSQTFHLWFRKISSSSPLQEHQTTH